MTVLTKYGKGTLLGIDTTLIMTYAVLLDNINEKELPEEDREYNVMLPIKNRIVNCMWIQILSVDGQLVEFTNTIKIL